LVIYSPSSLDIVNRGDKALFICTSHHLTVIISFFRADLVPTYSYGENDLYQQADNPAGSWLRSSQEKFKRVIGISPPIFYGRGVFNYTFGTLPYRHAITSVGK